MSRPSPRAHVALVPRRRIGAVAVAASFALAACSGSAPPELAATGTGTQSSALTTPSFKQVASATPQSPASTVTVKYAGAQTAGDLNVVIVGWNDTTAAVTGVTDTKGNSYLLAVGPTTSPGALTQSIYYAKNIATAAAGANTVTVTFSVAAQWADIRILEYAGVDTAAPLDATAGASGTAATSDSGALTTTGANELLVAGNMVTGVTTGPGSGFTQRIITTPDADLAEDRVAATAGTYHGTAPVSGTWVMQMVAFRSTPGDTQPPTAPGSAVATAASSSQINLGWTAATDNTGVTGYRIERCQGAGCSSFAQIAAPAGTGTTYADAGLAPSTSYSYRIRATDAAGNLGPYSNTATAVTLADTQLPTAPSNLTATAAVNAQINLAWTAATDNVGVTGYLIERCQGAGCSSFAQIAAPAGTGTTYGDAGLAVGTSYSYRVRARDAAGNLGPYSNVASATTLAPDTQPPTAPSGLTATAVSNTQINLAWTAATDNVGVTGYLVERCQGASCTSFAQIAAPAGTGTSYGDSGLLATTSYSYQVRARDAAGNLGPYSGVASATTLSTPANPVTPTFAQGNYAAPQSSSSTVSVPFPAAQSAGDLNVVAVGWNDSTASVTGISDSKGNAYQLAIGPTRLAGALSQSIYYAPNIAAASAGANTVTVTFSALAAFPDIRVLEYRGVAHTGPLDVAVGATGSNASSSSGSVVTTNPADLLIGANMVQTITSGPGAGYSLRLLTVPDSDLVEDRTVTSTGSYSATAPLSSAGGWVMQLVAFKAAPGDTTPPTVSITSPAGGATLTGTAASVTVSASDPDSGVQAIQLFVDGIPVGTIATAAPATFSLDTTRFTNGAHSLGATAVNGAHGTGSASPVAVTFNNATPGNPAVTGLWSGLVSLPLVPVHVSQLPDAKILMSDGQSMGGDAWTWDTATNAFVNVPVPANVFCSGHEQMADGRIFVTGGHNGAAHWGLPVNNAFDPVTQSWTVLPNMTYPRWYPTATTLPDGREFVLSGETNCDGCYETISEIYAPSTNTWTRITNAPFSFPYYPHVYVLPDGRILVPATAEAPIVSQILDLNARTWTAVGGPAVEGGSSAMYRASKVLKTGTSVDPDTATRNSSTIASVLDLTQATPTWRTVAPMAFARTYHTLTILPDGNVLATGGGPTTAATDTARAILQAELWSSTTETWTTLASMHAPRLYHSEAVLMPDARVLVLGGGRFDDTTVSTDQFNAEFYSPPYLFKGPRPVIASAPSTLPLGQAFSVQTPDAARIASVVLMRFTSVTHAINMGQRYVPLSFTAGSGSLTVTAPANSNLATPGNYLLFLVDTNGVPSVAAQVRL